MGSEMDRRSGRHGEAEDLDLLQNPLNAEFCGLDLPNTDIITKIRKL